MKTIPKSKFLSALPLYINDPMQKLMKLFLNIFIILNNYI